MTDEPWEALERAIALAVTAHSGQRDKAGKPYILHLVAVMHSVSNPFEKQAAVLHDYIEDVGGSVQELRRQAISERAITAIEHLTRSESSTYSEYIIKLANDPIATAVKLADIEDNYRIERVAYRAEHQTEDATRIQMYALSHQFLSTAIQENEYRSRMLRLESKP